MKVHALRDQVTAQGSSGERGNDTESLVAGYWRLVPEENLLGCSRQDLIAGAVSHREVALQRNPGETVIRTAFGSDCQPSVFQIVTDDKPFLVDSVTAVFTGRNLEIRLLAHPVVVVHRDRLGALVRIRPDVAPEEAAPDDLVESWMRVEVGGIADEQRLQEVGDALGQVLADVRNAVADWPKMLGKATSIAQELSRTPLPVPEKDLTDAVELLRWLADDNFTFLGYREYRLIEGDDGALMLDAVRGTGLGILRAETAGPRVVSAMTDRARAKVLEKRLLIITKANSRATVLRPAYLDYIAFRQFDADGNAIGEKRFLGLFASAAYRTGVRELPVVKRKVDEVIKRSGVSPRGHIGKTLLEILESYPRDDLFQISTDQLYETAMTVLRLTSLPKVRLFLRPDVHGRFISCLIYLPRERFTTASQQKIQEILLGELNGMGVDCATRVTESALAQLHFIVRTDPASPPGEVDIDRLTATINEVTRLWAQDLRTELERKFGREGGSTLYHRYIGGLPNAYQEQNGPAEAARDIAEMERLVEAGQFALHVRAGADETQVRAKVFRHGEPVALSAVVPVPHALGIEVTDERPYEISRSGDIIYLYDLGFRLPAGSGPLAEMRSRLEAVLTAIWWGTAEVDSFNALVLTAGLTWRQVMILRAYAKYLRQTESPYPQEYMERTLRTHPRIAADLVALFEARFDPGLALSQQDRERGWARVADRIGEQLDLVAGLDHDRVLRGFLTLILATTRTSYFQRDTDGRRKPYLAIKFDPEAISALPHPRPKHEIFVYSPRFEGVHLRFGSVARGGLRWSDRTGDYRVEVLGLVKAQLVKNAVIVPTGAKGCFLVKRVPATDRERHQAEGIACYRMFVSALLDLTDDLGDDGVVKPPRDLVRYDGDDPYLVVAADKGTATFSDIANEVSKERGFWLGDGFASGGSTGYDHKKMGITARGVWESVRRHLAEAGIDSDTEDFSVVGIGDMSGDVFGNGMLLSNHIRLLAAFDHGHVFVDPDPDPAASYAERRRLFELPGSTWADYNQSFISPGGGVWPRQIKAVPVSPQMRAALGIDESLTVLTPVELIQAILKAPVDLLWSGGIGTYVKAAPQSHAIAGDRANDHARVDGKQLRCKVIGEGGNLGLTQRGRVEYALTGGRVNADFIDNSAGVNCSDYEVNIKILLDIRMGTENLPEDERRGLLAGMADDVARLVLRDNYLQARVLGSTLARGHVLLPEHRRMIKDFERRRLLNRTHEEIPSDEMLAERAAGGAGLTSPELSILLAHSKIAAKRAVGGSYVCDEAWTAEALASYFPKALHERFADAMAQHPLRREIATNYLVNEAINRAGISFFFRAMEQTGAGVADILRCFVVVREVFRLEKVWQATDSLDRSSIGAQNLVDHRIHELFEHTVHWLLSKRPSPIDVQGEITRLKDGVGRLLPRLAAPPPSGEGINLTGQELSDEVADLLVAFGYGARAFDMVEIARTTGHQLDEIVEVYLSLSERLRVSDLQAKISVLPKEDRSEALARMTMHHDLNSFLAELTAHVVTGANAQAKVADWERANAEPLGEVLSSMSEVNDRRADFPAISVLLRQIRSLVRVS